MTKTLTCPGCGRPLDVPPDYTRRKIRCPDCGVYSELPAPAAKKQPTRQPAGPARPAAPAPPSSYGEWPEEKVEPVVAAPAPPPPRPKTAEPMSDDDDGLPYQFAGGPEKKCPDCNHLLEPDALLCPECGYNLETSQKAVKVYTRVERSWEAGLPQGQRLFYFLAGQLGIALVSLLGAWLAGSTFAFFTPWLLFTALSAFILGTYDRLDLSRSKRGKVVLTRTWRICFLRRPPSTIPVYEYEGVTTGQAHDPGILDWLTFIGLALMGLIPGLLWWFLAIHRDTFSVSLTKNHGFPELTLYQGWSESRARDIADTLHEVVGLPRE